MSRTCTVHQWSHPTEPCPYCREIGSLRTDSARAERLSAAIGAAVSGDASRITQHYTPDVVGSAPAISVSSRDELAVEIAERDGALTDIEIAFSPLPVSGHQAAVEWVASGVPSAPLDLDLGGHRVRIRAVTVAEFDGEQICSFRCYWDDLPKAPDLGDAPSG
jgi:hypothetical protein